MCFSRHLQVRARGIVVPILLGLAITTLAGASWAGIDSLQGASAADAFNAPILPSDADLAAALSWSQGDVADPAAITRLNPIWPSPATSEASAGTGVKDSPMRAQIQRWRGRFCPPTGCPAPASARATDIAAFGCVAFGGAWLARRRVPNPS